jgi:hypothetical protein
MTDATSGPHSGSGAPEKRIEPRPLRRAASRHRGRQVCSFGRTQPGGLLSALARALTVRTMNSSMIACCRCSARKAVYPGRLCAGCLVDELLAELERAGSGRLDPRITLLSAHDDGQGRTPSRVAGFHPESLARPPAQALRRWRRWPLRSSTGCLSLSSCLATMTGTAGHDGHLWPR